MSNPLDIDSMRQTFARVSAYRDLCRHVRNTGKSNFFWGVVFFAIWSSVHGGQFRSMISYAHFSIACLEMGIGLWKWIMPSAECLLLDALIFFAFASLNLYRAALPFLANGGGGGGRVDMVSILFGVYMGYHGFEQFRGYLNIRKLFVQRPSSANLAYVDDMIRDIRRGKPEADPRALDLPTRPRLKAQLAGEIALFVEPATNTLFIVGKDEMHLERRDGTHGEPTGTLFLGSQVYEQFPLSEPNWDNYRRWK